MSEPTSTTDSPGGPVPLPFLYNLRNTTIRESSPTSEKPTRIHRGFGEEYQPIINNEERFVVYVDISYFNPEELEVKVDGPFLCLEAVQESSNEVNFVKRLCTSRWTLPPDVDSNAITSTLYDGKLTINCPKKKKEPVIVRIEVVHENR